MQSQASSRYSHSCIDAGVDWITCTATGKDARKAFLSEGEAILQQEAGRGVEITSARIRDYVGWKAPGVFIGSRQADDLIVLSSSHAARLWKTVAPLATNVSRLDLQATVWTHGEQPQLSRWYYQRVRRLPPQRGRPRSLSLIQSHPNGDTLYVGKRQSDCFGRCYDYAAAHKSALPRTQWRFEVEFKRHLAARRSRELLGSSDPRATTESVVASWYRDRGLDPTWKAPEFLATQVAEDDQTERDALRWFQTSVSKTVAREIRRHGLETVLDALNLSGLVVVNSKRR